MAGRRIAKRTRRHPDALFAAKSPPRKVPFEFVLDAVANAGAYTKFFFGCTAVYVGDKIVFVLSDKPAAVADNGVWIATTREHHASLKRELPCRRRRRESARENDGRRRTDERREGPGGVLEAPAE